MKKLNTQTKSRIYMYIFVVVAYILTFNIVTVSAYESIKICEKYPEIVEYSTFINLVVDR